MSYHLLLVREDGLWTPQFGDHDKECVEFEREDYRDHDIAARDLKIVRFARVPSNAQVTAKLAEFNA
jgi:hypothetical protein